MNKIKIIRNTTASVCTLILLVLAITPSAISQNHFSGPRSMGAVLNSTDNEVAPTISPNGLSLYFATNRPVGGQGGNDLWVSQRATLSSAWGAPQNLGATLNTSSGESAPAFSLDGRTMFFASDRLGIGGTDIYISTRTDPNNDFGWTAPVNLGAVLNSTLNDIAPNYFEDPTTGSGTLIFSSNRVGNPQFDFHLYQSTRNANGTFNAPTPIKELGTLGGSAELRSAMTRDGLQIFFASARPEGLGAPPPGTPTFDTFVATRASISAPWNTPVLVPGVNTVADERNPSLSPDGSILYFQSDRPGGLGGTELYSATRCSLYSASPCGVNRTIADFNGDGQTDLTVFRPSDSTWHSMLSGTNEYRVQQFGFAGDQPVDGDFDGDGRNDIAIFRSATGDWWILRSSDNSAYAVHWGLGTDTLVPGDYDADRKTDPAVYRGGTWYILQSSNGQLNQQQFGLSGDIPVAGANAQ